MDTLKFKTKSANKNTVEQKWHLIDAEGLVLGRLASTVANIIRGKNKPDFTPHINTGDKVVIVNAEKVRLTGKKLTDKQYVRHTGYPGGRRYSTPLEILEKDPTRLISKAVENMLPKNKLQKPYMHNMHVYAGNEHPHESQNPEELKIKA